ncbi:MAG: yfkM [Gammaproteobacteria bacterium]|jgi:protease I|nr:yfkM [Gammaproteobacteria bacterium]
MQNLSGKRIAILVANGFEQVEMTEPKEALEKEGAKTEIISPEKDKVKGWKHNQWGDEFSVDVSLERANSSDYDALLLPGGVINPDKLRMSLLAIDFIKKMFQEDKPIAAICHGPWTLINAGVVKGYTVTSWPSIKVDLMNAGANWVDEESVKDRKLVTSRKPEDIPYFNKAMIALFAEK